MAGAVAIAIAIVAAGLAASVSSRPTPRPRHPDAALIAVLLPGWTLYRWELLRIACAGLALVVGWSIGIAPVLAVAGIAAPSVMLRLRERRRASVAASRSLEILRATQAALRGGSPLAPALRLALGGIDRLAAEPYLRALRAFDLNSPLDASLGGVASTVSDRRVALALQALALVAAEQLPAIRASAIIGSVADRLAFEGRLAEEVHARSSGARAQIVLLALLVPVLAAHLAATMPGLAATLASPLGTRVLLPAAAVFEIAGIIASRRIVRGVTR